MLGERLRAILIERDITVTQFAEMCDLPLDTVKGIYYGKSVDPKLSTAAKMAEALNLSINCLMGKCQHTPAERALLQHYRNCGKHGKNVIEIVARYEATAMKTERDAKGKHKIPCVVPNGEIHKGIILDTCDNTEIETSIETADMAIQFTTNGLAPLYCKDDIILLENRFPNNGEVAVFYDKDKAYIRKFIDENNQYRLQCLHKQGVDIILKNMRDIDYMGTIISVLRG